MTTSVVHAPDGHSLVAFVLDPAARRTERSQTRLIQPCEPSDAPATVSASAKNEIVVASVGEPLKAKALAAANEELVGPPAPSKTEQQTSAQQNPGVQQQRDARQKPGAPSDQAPTVVAADGPEELVGPPLPADWSPRHQVVLAGAVPPLSHEQPNVLSAIRSEAPKTEPVVTDSVAAPHQGESEIAERDFEDFAASDESKPDGAAEMHGLRHRFRWGESVSQVLARAGVPREEIDQWVRATNDEYNVHRVYAGQEIELLMSMPARRLQTIRMEIDPQTILMVERHDSGPRARREQIPFDKALRAVGGRIEKNLYTTAQSYGIPEKVISDMAEILGWDLDLASDLEPGASFRVVYEELTRPDTMETIAGRLMAVELVNRRDRHEGYYFAMPDGSHPGYYDRDGKGIGRGFLRFPVAATKVSSNFSSARFHPILKISVPHYGVDFAAPTGTPVRAVADGRVIKAGWNGGNGKFVKLQHDAVYETGYSHLSSIAPTVRAGGSVKQGQVIGYVGATGLATGPHLHFAMYRNGKYVDPMKANLPRTQSLDGRNLAAFRMRVGMMERAYASAGLYRLPTRMAEIQAGSSIGGGGQ